jgi:phage-related protein
LDGNAYRTVFMILADTMILLHAFQKRTGATPHKDLEIARRRQREVLS